MELPEIWDVRSPNVITDLEVPAGLERAQWLGLTVAPGFEYGWWWFEFGETEMDAVIAAFREMHALGSSTAGDGYYPPMMSEHTETAKPVRSGDVLDLRKWVDPRTDYLWFVGLVQWTPEAWASVEDGAFRYISPHYGPVSDGQGNWWELGFREASTAIRPLQRNIGSIQSWQKRSGVAASQDQPPMTRIKLMSGKRTSTGGAPGASSAQASGRPAGSVQGVGAPTPGVAANSDEAIERLTQMVNQVLQKQNEMTGDFAKLRSRVDILEGGKKDGGDEGGDDDSEPTAGEGEKKEEKKEEMTDDAAASVNARVRRLEVELRTEKRRTALASLPAGNAMGLTADDAEMFADMGDKAFSSFMARASANTQPTTPAPQPSTPSPGSVFTRQNVPAAASANNPANNAPTGSANGDDEERLRDEAWKAAEVRASALRKEGKAASMSELYQEERKARGIA